MIHCLKTSHPGKETTVKLREKSSDPNQLWSRHQPMMTKAKQCKFKLFLDLSNINSPVKLTFSYGLIIVYTKSFFTMEKAEISLERHFKGVLHLWALFLKTWCIFSKNKATSDRVSYGSGQKCSKELENYSFTSVETIVVKLQWKMCENQYFPCFEP